MPGACRVLQDKYLTGVILGPGAPTVLVNAKPVSTETDKISAHGSPPHAKATVVKGSTTVRAMGKGITVQGMSPATCAHVPTTGSLTVQVGF